MNTRVFTTQDERREAMKEKLCEIAEGVLDPYAVDEFLFENGFYAAPASTKYHGAYAGGLFDHSWAVYEALNNLTEKLELRWDRPESPFIIGLFHDLCKIDKYTPDIDNPYPNINPKWVYVKTPVFGEGHGIKSVAIASILFQLTEQEMFCIRYHMGAYEKEQWEEYDKAIRRHPNVLWTHTADMQASKIWDV